MRNRMMIIAIVGIMLLLVGCSTEYSESNKVDAVAWEEDGKILYVRRYIKWRTVYNPLGQNCEVIGDTFYLNRCNSDGGSKEEIMVLTGQLGGWSAVNINSGGDWAVIGMMGGYARMYIVKLDGSEKDSIIDNTGLNLYPDLSPDGSKIVYAKKGQGIWIMNRDGSGDHQIVNDTTASYPAWSPDDTLIAYGGWWTHIVTLNGDSVKVYPQKSFLDWGPKGSNLILIQPYNGLPVILNILTEDEDTLHFGAYKWSNDGKYIVGSDSGGYYSINIDGTNKHYIEP